METMKCLMHCIHDRKATDAWNHCPISLKWILIWNLHSSEHRHEINIDFWRTRQHNNRKLLQIYGWNKRER